MRRITLPLTAAVATLALTGCGAFTPAPSATVTVTATPSAAPSTAVPAPVQTSDAPAVATTPPAPVETPLAVPTAVETPTTPVVTSEPAPTQDTDLGVSIVASEGMEGDDYIVHLVTASEALAAQRQAPGILASRVRSLTGTPQAKNIDLVAVFGSDGAMVTSTRLPDGKYAGATSGL